jgi:hypothetical protein
MTMPSLAAIADVDRAQRNAGMQSVARRRIMPVSSGTELGPIMHGGNNVHLRKNVKNASFGAYAQQLDRRSGATSLV